MKRQFPLPRALRRMFFGSQREDKGLGITLAFDSLGILSAPVELFF